MGPCWCSMHGVRCSSSVRKYPPGFGSAHVAPEHRPAPHVCLFGYPCHTCSWLAGPAVLYRLLVLHAGPHCTAPHCSDLAVMRCAQLHTLHASHFVTLHVSPLLHRRARAFAKKLNDAPLAIVDKRRSAHNVSEVMNLIGDVRGKVGGGGQWEELGGGAVGGGPGDFFGCKVHAPPHEARAGSKGHGPPFLEDRAALSGTPSPSALSRA